MNEKIVYWVCGLGIVTALVPLIWVLVQKCKGSKQSIQQVMMPADQENLDRMWRVARDLLCDMTAPYNRLEVFSDQYSLTHEVQLVGRRRTDSRPETLVHLRVAYNQAGQPCYFFNLNEGKRTSSNIYPFHKMVIMKRILEGVLVNPAFTTNPKVGADRKVYLGPEHASTLYHG